MWFSVVDRDGLFVVFSAKAKPSEVPLAGKVCFPASPPLLATRGGLGAPLSVPPGLHGRLEWASGSISKNIHFSMVRD